MTPAYVQPENSLNNGGHGNFNNVRRRRVFNCAMEGNKVVNFVINIKCRQNSCLFYILS
jgi:hypothetical protein